MTTCNIQTIAMELNLILISEAENSALSIDQKGITLLRDTAGKSRSDFHVLISIHQHSLLKVKKLRLRNAMGSR